MLDGQDDYITLALASALALAVSHFQFPQFIIIACTRIDIAGVRGVQIAASPLQAAKRRQYPLLSCGGPDGDWRTNAQARCVR